MPGRRASAAMAAANKPQGRDAIWAEIRKQRTFTRRSICDATDIPHKTVVDYLKSLEAAGYLTSKALLGQSIIYGLEKDPGVETPRVRKDGSHVTQGSINEQMWRTMKMLVTFTADELALAASLPDSIVSKATAVDYCRKLAEAGYMATLVAGKPNRAARYRFVRNTGPKPPQITRIKVVFDPNLQEIVDPEVLGALT